MRRTAAFAALAVLTAAPAVRAQPAVAVAGPAVAAAVEAPPKIVALVEQLGSPDYRTREKASALLDRVGDQALPALRAALNAGPEPEVARRLDLLIRKLDADRLTLARTVTLKGTNLSAKAALAEIARQSGYAIRADGVGDDSAKYTFDLAGVPFWKALDQVCDAAGLSANLQDDDGKIAVFFSDTFNPFATYAGPFRVVASHVTTNQNLQLAGLPRGRPLARQPDFLNVNFQITSEPKVPLVGIGQAEAIRAVDDAGASLLPNAEAAQFRTSYYSMHSAYRSYTMSAGVNLNRSARGAAEVRELKVRVPVMVLSDTRPDAVIPNVLAAKGKRATGRELEVEVTDVSDQNGAIGLTLLLTRRAGNPDDYNWLNGLTQRIEVHDERGRKMQLGSWDQNSNGPNVTTVTVGFTPTDAKAGGKPAKLVVVEWVTLTREIEFTLKNIPLP